MGIFDVDNLRYSILSVKEKPLRAATIVNHVVGEVFSGVNLNDGRLLENRFGVFQLLQTHVPLA